MEFKKNAELFLKEQFFFWLDDITSNSSISKNEIEKNFSKKISKLDPEILLF
ncbi:MAG: hypothetical protein LBC17_03375 [Lactobacillaceae bacterium]|jgi:hypothetical protein|nr:hypothetical protein [Lactobacillaceae bacterium]